jgi:hypothetical protein
MGMNISALSTTVSWILTVTTIDVSAQVVATNADCTASNTPGAMFFFDSPQLKNLDTIRMKKSELINTYQSPMTVSNGVWYYTFVSNDQSRQAWRQGRSEIATDDFGKVGEIGFFGKKFAVTEGPAVVNMNHLPDANRDEMIREKARRVEFGGGVFMSEKDGFGYCISKNLSVSAKSTSKIEFSWRF